MIIQDDNKKSYGHYIGNLILNSLSNYEALTVQQMATLLGYSVDYIYTTLGAMQTHDLVVAEQIPIYAPASKLYRLNKKRNKQYENGNSTIRFILSNQFVCEGIFAFYDKNGQGIIDWLGGEGVINKYSQDTDKNKKEATILPQAYLEIQNENGRAFMILETILDSDNKDEIRTEMEHYINRLREVYNQIEKIHLLYLVNNDDVLEVVVDLWRRLTSAPPYDQRLPLFFVANFNHIAEEGFFGPFWCNREKDFFSFSDFISADKKSVKEESFLGKKRKNQSGWNFRPLIPSSPMVQSLSEKRIKKKQVQQQKLPKENNIISENTSNNEENENQFSQGSKNIETSNANEKANKHQGSPSDNEKENVKDEIFFT